MQPDQTPLHASQGSGSATKGDATGGLYAQNHELMLEVMRGGDKARETRVPAHTLTVRLERILVDRSTGELVPFDGEAGVEVLLEQLARLMPSFARSVSEGHLVGISGTGSTRHDSSVPVRIELGPGAQVAYAVGPTTSIISVLQVFEGLDRRLHTASTQLGRDYVLLAEGYNPLVSSPLDVALVPRTRWTLLNAFLGQTGRYARDAMRCSCATTMTFGFSTEREALAAYRLATALSPLLMFLTDNVRSFRGAGARLSPRMVRSIIVGETDDARCGVVPGSLDADFSFEKYLAWAEGLQPILFEDGAGTTSSTGKRTLAEVMDTRELTAHEAQGLLLSALPSVRLGHGVELLQADALRPRMAAGYAAFLKGLLLFEPSLHSAASLIGTVGENDVNAATFELRQAGWDATIYGKRVVQLVDQLIRIARSSFDDGDELRVMDELIELWDVRMVPRDAFVHQETKAHRGW